MNMSFFARPSYIGRGCIEAEYECIYRMSSVVRAEQIAQYLGAKYNPKDGYENDVCIFQKPRDLSRVRGCDYVDVGDGQYLIPLLKKRPDVKIIVVSECSRDHLMGQIKNEMVLIPQQHLNWERDKRNRKEITTGGYIGMPSFVQLKIRDEISGWMKDLGMDFITCFDYKNRQDAINFYKSIDFLLIGDFGYMDVNFPFSTPAKMINAASFGVPSIANWRLGFDDFKGNYKPVKTMGEMIEEVKKFKDKDYYDEFSHKIIKEAEKYHISNIAEKYRQLIR